MTSKIFAQILLGNLSLDEDTNEKFEEAKDKLTKINDQIMIERYVDYNSM